MAAVRNVYVIPSFIAITDDLNEVCSAEKSSAASARNHLPMFRKHQQAQTCDGWAILVPEVTMRYVRVQQNRNT
jgi:hypothetical protein